MSGFVSLTDESSEEEKVKGVMKEEHDMDVAHSWMEVGGASIGREGNTRVVVSGISLCLVLLSLSNYSFTVLWLFLAFVTDPLFSFFPGVGFVEMGQCYGKKCSSWKWRGCRRLSWLWQDWRWRVCMGSRGEPYHIPLYPLPHPHPKDCHTPTTTISKLAPQESEGVKPEASAPKVGGVELTLEAPSSAVSPSSGGSHPCQHDTPSPVGEGHQKGVQMLG